MAVADGVAAMSLRCVLLRARARARAAPCEGEGEGQGEKERAGEGRGGRTLRGERQALREEEDKERSD